MKRSCFQVIYISSTAGSAALDISNMSVNNDTEEKKGNILGSDD
jgi:hypothetical protein